MIIKTIRFTLRRHGCCWTKWQLYSDSKAVEREMLKGIHETTFEGHVCKIE